ncbi:MAG: hypothetical protein JWM53_6970 [bacterium]|nr:hypothetical protein [bacterium]
MFQRSLALLLTLAAASGCKRQAPPAPAPVAVAPAAADAQRTPGKGATDAGLELHVPLVYVDGEPRAALAYNELPAALALDGAHRAKLCDYFKLLGAECAKIQRVDFHVAGDTVFVAGADLRKARGTTFHFSDGLAGRPRVDGTLVAGDVTDVVVWVAAPPGGMLKDDGRRGVRVNVDGRLAAKIKRNLLEGNVEPVVEPRPGEVARYRLRDFLASRAVTVARIRGIDLITRDERVVRVAADDVVAGVEFIAPDKGHGEMTFLVGGHAIPALAVDVWAETAPPTRAMRRAGELHAALDERP